MAELAPAHLTGQIVGRTITGASANGRDSPVATCGAAAESLAIQRPASLPTHMQANLSQSGAQQASTNPPSPAGPEMDEEMEDTAVQQQTAVMHQPVDHAQAQGYSARAEALLASSSQAGHQAAAIGAARGTQNAQQVVLYPPSHTATLSGTPTGSYQDITEAGQGAHVEHGYAQQAHAQPHTRMHQGRMGIGRGAPSIGHPSMQEASLPNSHGSQAVHVPVHAGHALQPAASNAQQQQQEQQQIQQELLPVTAPAVAGADSVRDADSEDEAWGLMLAAQGLDEHGMPAGWESGDDALYNFDGQHISSRPSARQAAAVGGGGNRSGGCDTTHGSADSQRPEPVAYSAGMVGPPGGHVCRLQADRERHNQSSLENEAAVERPSWPSTAHDHDACGPSTPFVSHRGSSNTGNAGIRAHALVDSCTAGSSSSSSPAAQLESSLQGRPPLPRDADNASASAQSMRLGGGQSSAETPSDSQCSFGATCGSSSSGAGTASPSLPSDHHHRCADAVQHALAHTHMIDVEGEEARMSEDGGAEEMPQLCMDMASFGAPSARALPAGTGHAGADADVDADAAGFMHAEDAEADAGVVHAAHDPEEHEDMQATMVHNAEAAAHQHAGPSSLLGTRNGVPAQGGVHRTSHAANAQKQEPEDVEASKSEAWDSEEDEQPLEEQEVQEEEEGWLIDPETDTEYGHACTADAAAAALACVCCEDEWSDDETEEADTTAQQLAQGKDIQGIPWDRLHFSREHYRATRLRQYRNYTNVLPEDGTPEAAAAKEQMLASCTTMQPTSQPFFEFVRNHRAVQSNIVHFQLRNLVWAVSRNDVFVVHDNNILHYNPLSRTTTEVLNLAGGAKGRQVPGVGRVQVSTTCVRDGIIAAGGFTGELVVRSVEHDSLLYSGRITHSENGITNGLEAFACGRLGTCVLSANNDAMLRLYAGSQGSNGFRSVQRVEYGWAVNYATVCPTDTRLAAVVGDDPTTYLTDLTSGMTVSKLEGHADFSFAVAWHPGGHLLATGNQDTTTLVWDIRYPGRWLARLAGRMGAIRSLRFSACGAYLAACEPADFVHLYSTASGFVQHQDIDFFGEIAGLSFSPEADALFVGISDMTYSSLLQLERCMP